MRNGGGGAKNSMAPQGFISFLLGLGFGDWGLVARPWKIVILAVIVISTDGICAE